MGASIRKLMLITTGSFLIAFSVVVFFTPNHIATGGPPGIGIILFYLLGIPVGVTVFALNVVLLTIGGRLLGRSYFLRTAFTIVAISCFIELLAHYLPAQIWTHELLLNVLYGGILIGIGTSLCFRGEAAPGGLALTARIIATKLNLGVGKVLQFMDGSIIVASGLLFKNIESALWAGIGVYITGAIVDMVMEGQKDSKLVLVSTKQAEKLTKLFPERLAESGSFVHCNTLKDVAGHDLMLLVAETREVSLITSTIEEVDKDAYFAVLDAEEFHSVGKVANSMKTE